MRNSINKKNLAVLRYSYCILLIIIWIILFLYDTGIVSNRNIFEHYSHSSSFRFINNYSILIFFLSFVFLIVLYRLRFKFIYLGFALYFTMIVSMPILYVKNRICRNITRTVICKTNTAEIVDVFSKAKTFQIIIKYTDNGIEYKHQILHSEDKIDIPQFFADPKSIIGDTILIHYPIYSNLAPFVIVKEGNTSSNKRIRKYSKYDYYYNRIYYPNYESIPKEIRKKNEERLLNPIISKPIKIYYNRFKYKL